MSRCALLCLLFVVIALRGWGQAAVIDVHDHIMARLPAEYLAAAADAVASMDALGIRMLLLMPPPEEGVIVPLHDCETLQAIVKAYPTRFAMLGGGGRLNIPIQQTATQTTVSDQVKQDFAAAAEDILRQGAVGFGEIALHHLSHNAHHPYESVPGDHPLLLLLADIAARHGVPLDLHLDVVTQEMAAPDYLAASPLNPTAFTPNLAAFERLLDHNPKATIIWEHCGTDTLGCWTAELTRRMLAQHPNLYIALRINAGKPGHYPLNYPMMRNGMMKPNWRQLFLDYPTRFLIGSDLFLAPAGVTSSPSGIQPITRDTGIPYSGVTQFLNLLPPDVARKIGSDNAMALYRLK